MLPRRGFVLMPVERSYVPLKNDTKDFYNNPLFERSGCFHVTITGDFEHF